MDIDDWNIDFTCDCTHQFTQTVGRVKADGGVTCPACGHFKAADQDFPEGLVADIAALQRVKVDDIGKLIAKQIDKARVRPKR